MSSKPRLIIHAGVHRTGTTSIQHLLEINRDTLAAHGVLYPLDYAPTPGGDPRRAGANHQRLAWALAERTLSGHAARQWLEPLAAGFETVILSGEDFCAIRNASFLGPLSEAFDIEAVFYLRRQDDYVNSWYNQHLRWPFDPRHWQQTPREFFDFSPKFYWLYYFDLLKNWSDLLGLGKVRVRVLEKGQVTDVVSDFLELAGLASMPLKHGPVINDSIPADHLELLRRIRLHRYSWGVRNMAREALAPLPARRSTNAFPASARREIVRRYALQNIMVARTYLDRPDGILFRDLTFPDDECDMDALVPPSDELIAGFWRNMMKLDQQYDLGGRALLREDLFRGLHLDGPDTA